MGESPQKTKDRGCLLFQMKKTQPRQPGCLETLSLEELFFEQGKLVGRHLASIGSECPIHLLTRGQHFILVELVCHSGDEALFQHRETLFDRLEVGQIPCLAGRG